MKLNTTMPIRWGRSFLLGVLAAVALAGLSPFWMLAQMGGPVPFTNVWLAVTVPFLLLASFLSKAHGFVALIICGVSFSMPVAIFCWVLSTIDPVTERYYRAEIRHDAVVTFILSVIMMMVAPSIRWLKQKLF